MLVVVQSGWVDKVRPGHSELFCFGIHHLHKGVDAAADGPCDCHGRVICRVYQKEVQKIPQSDLISDFQLAGLRVFPELKISIGHGHLFREIRLAFKGYESCHDFGQAGRVDLIVDPLGE